MRSTLLIAASSTILLQPMPAHAREVRLQPSSKWVLNYADDSCRLARNFGAGASQVTLILDQFTPGDTFRITVAGKPFQTKNRELPKSASVRFGPNERSNPVYGFSGMLGDLPAVIIPRGLRLAPLNESELHEISVAMTARKMPSWEPISPEREKAARWLELSDFWNTNVVLETGPMDRAMDALDVCSWEAVKRWGLDVERLKWLSRGVTPKTDPTSWLSRKDYPTKMLRLGRQGVITFRLIVDERGKAESCTIQRSTRPKEFDDAVCQIYMQRARLDPALDLDGNPVRAFYVQTVSFIIR